MPSWTSCARGRAASGSKRAAEETLPVGVLSTSVAEKFARQEGSNVATLPAVTAKGHPGPDMVHVASELQKVKDQFAHEMQQVKDHFNAQLAQDRALHDARVQRYEHDLSVAVRTQDLLRDELRSAAN